MFEGAIETHCKRKENFGHRRIQVEIPAAATLLKNWNYQKVSLHLNLYNSQKCTEACRVSRNRHWATLCPQNLLGVD